MSTGKLQVSSKINRNKAKQLLFDFIHWGDHHHNVLRPLENSYLESVLRHNNYQVDAVIDDLMNNPHKTIPLFENLYSGAYMVVEASGKGVLTVDTLVNGVSTLNVQVNTQQSFRNAYIADFSSAVRARDAAITGCNFDEFLTMLTKGLSSIEAFMNLFAFVHNAKSSVDPISIERDISIEDKLKKWVPILAPDSSAPFEQSPLWSKFIELKRIRNDYAIHPKVGNLVPNNEQLAKYINYFRDSFALILFNLHVYLKIPAPSSIIRASHYPVVRAVK